MTRVSLGWRRSTAAVVVVAATLAATACGSRLDPNQIAGQTGDTVQGSGAAAGSSDVTGTGDTGTTTGTGDTGTGTGDTGTTSGTGSTGSGSTSTGTSAGSAKGAGSSTGGAKAGSCDGLANGPGITDTTITIGNSSDISGPVPGLFEAAQDAVKAYVAYFNSQNPDGLCGRKLVLKGYDSRADAGADQANYADGCANTFAMVGSMSAFDSGGAQTATKCGLPDLRAAAVTQERLSSPTTYGAQSTVPNEFENAVPDYVLKNFPSAAKSAAMLYINAGAAAENGQLQPKAMTKRGMTFKYVQGIGVAEFNYAPYVQQLKDRNIGYVQILGAVPQFVRMAQAMKQQNYKPDVLMFDPTAYTADFLQSGGDAVEGATMFINFAPFFEASKNPELATYLNWLQQVKPGADPTFFGVFAWSAARLFVQEATKLGGKLTRQTLLQALSKVDNWTCNNLHSRQHVGARHTGDGWRFVQVKNGQWVPVGGTSYNYAGTTTVN